MTPAASACSPASASVWVGSARYPPIRKPPRPPHALARAMLRTARGCSARTSFCCFAPSAMPTPIRLRKRGPARWPAATCATLQAPAAFGALAVEDEAHQAPVVALADLIEAERAAALGVGAHDGADAHDRRAALDGGEAELDLLADLQRARPG